MKKISLKSVRETLTRKEMRSITGGCSFCGCYNYTCMRYFGKSGRCSGDACCTYQGSSGSW